MTAEKTPLSLSSPLWLTQLVLVFVAPTTDTELSGLMTVSQGDQYVA